MLYQKTISTPKNTSLLAAKHTTLNVVQGVITLLDVLFPEGSCGLLYVTIVDEGYQVYPETPGEALSGNGVHFTLPDAYLIKSPSRLLDVYTYNLDDTYDHSVIIKIICANTQELADAVGVTAINNQLAAIATALSAVQSSLQPQPVNRFNAALSVMV